MSLIDPVNLKAMIGRTVAATCERQLVAPDETGEIHVWTEQLITFTDGSTIYLGTAPKDSAYIDIDDIVGIEDCTRTEDGRLLLPRD